VSLCRNGNLDIVALGRGLLSASCNAHERDDRTVGVGLLGSDGGCLDTR